MIPWWRTELGEDEIRAVQESIRDRHINQGPVCREFEQRLAEQLHVPHVVTCSSGSAALYMALTACGVKSGDEVIVPAMTFIATAHAVSLCGAVVRFVDVQPDRPVIDVMQVEQAVNERTRAIVPVHLNGIACDMAKINAIASRHGLKVIEDAAQAFTAISSLGALGTLGDAGIFSMSIAKLMTTGEGGFVVTKHDRTYELLLKLRNQGVLNVKKNEFHEFGFNFRFNDMLAAIGLVQLRNLPQKIRAAKQTYQFYRDRLESLDYLRMMKIEIDDGELPLWSQVFCANRSRIVTLMEEHGIQTRPINPPLSDSAHLQCAGEFPNANRLSAGILGLPSGPSQTQQDLQRVVDALHTIRDQVQAVPDSQSEAQTDA